MYNNSALIPAKFLILIAHLCVCIILLWNNEESTNSCFLKDYNLEYFWNHQTQLIVGLGVAVGMIAFELVAFASGFTMFHDTSSLLSIICHFSASILLAQMIFENWHCDWFWWIFSFCSVLPLANDFYIVIDAIANRKY